MEETNKNLCLLHARNDRLAKEIARKKEQKFIALPRVDQASIGRKNLYELEVAYSALDYLSNTSCGLVNEIEEKDINLNAANEKLAKAEKIINVCEDKKKQDEYFSFCEETDEKAAKEILNNNNNRTPKKQEMFKKSNMKYNMELMMVQERAQRFCGCGTPATGSDHLVGGIHLKILPRDSV